jgi:PPOX class probable FMN-dependent enzyme
MTLAPWRSPLSRALHRNRSQPNARYVQLATLRPDGRPANRTVVFRGILDDDSNALQFVTDTRSEKVDQLRQNPQTEACWYFPKTREQFRLGGVLDLVTADTTGDLQLARETAWAKLSENARLQFVWPDPGQPRRDRPFPTEPPTESNPVPCFGLLLLYADRVDHLELRGDPQNRTVYVKRDRTWDTEIVNP